MMRFLSTFLLLVFLGSNSLAQNSGLPNNLKKGQEIKVEIRRSACFSQKEPLFVFVKYFSKDSILLTNAKYKTVSYEFFKNKKFRKTIKTYSTGRTKLEHKKEARRFLEKYQLVLNKIYYDSIIPFDRIKKIPYTYLTYSKRVRLENFFKIKKTVSNYSLFKRYYQELLQGKHDKDEGFESEDGSGGYIIAGLGTNYIYYFKDSESSSFKQIGEKHVSGWKSQVFAK